MWHLQPKLIPQQFIHSHIFVREMKRKNYIPKSMENSISLSLRRCTSYMLFAMHILATVSAELFGVVFESSE
jgi:hypothetical protein